MNLQLYGTIVLGLLLLLQGCKAEEAEERGRYTEEQKIIYKDEVKTTSLATEEREPEKVIVANDVVPPNISPVVPLPEPIPLLTPFLVRPFNGGGRNPKKPKSTVKPKKDDWPRWGQNSTNNHHNQAASISTSDVLNLVEVCAIDYTRGVSIPGITENINSEPIIVNNVVYWTGWGGQVGAARLRRDSNNQIEGCDDLWVQDISTLLDLDIETTEPSVRVSPAYYVTNQGRGALLYTGIGSPFMFPTPFIANETPVFAFALDALSGKLVFSIEAAEAGIEDPDNAYPQITSSPVVHDGVAYFGIASVNNVYSSLLNVPISHRGQVVALDLNGEGSNGSPFVKWRQFMIPKKPTNWEGQWFAGGGVWGGGASILPNVGRYNKGIIYFGTGQLYAYPQFTADCMSELVPPENFNGFIADRRGQTGGGALECYQRSVDELRQMGIDAPLATNSVVALNMDDGSFVWHYNTQGIDAWQLGCGPDADETAPGCTVNIAGPDWDIGGSAPVLAGVDNKYQVISHTKGGAIFLLDALSGEKIYNLDLCTGSIFGGIHWGLSYDAENEHILAACSGGSYNAVFGSTIRYLQILADGTETCATGFLNAIDIRTGDLKWQAVAAQSAPLVDCPITESPTDLRFKDGLSFDFIYNNRVDPGVVVHHLPSLPDVPVVAVGAARMHSPASIADNKIFVTTLLGSTYILNAPDGSYINQILCDRGGSYQGVSVTSDAVAFGCGYAQIGTEFAGSSIMVYSPSQL